MERQLINTKSVSSIKKNDSDFVFKSALQKKNVLFNFLKQEFLAGETKSLLIMSEAIEPLFKRLMLSYTQYSYARNILQNACNYSEGSMLGPISVHGVGVAVVHESSCLFDYFSSLNSFKFAEIKAMKTNFGSYINALLNESDTEQLTMLTADKEQKPVKKHPFE